MTLHVGLARPQSSLFVARAIHRRDDPSIRSQTEDFFHSHVWEDRKLLIPEVLVHVKYKGTINLSEILVGLRASNVTSVVYGGHDKSADI